MAFDLISVQVSGREDALHKFLSRYPHEVNVVKREKERVTARLLVPLPLIEALKGLQLHIDQTYNFTEHGLAILSQVSQINRFLAATSLSKLIKQSEKYFTPDEVKLAIERFPVDYPGMVRVVDLPNQTAEGTWCKALCLGHGSIGTKDAIVITGGAHAREWGSAEIALSFAVDLLDAYVEGRDLPYAGKVFKLDGVRALLDKVHVVVFPLVNPDGLSYSRVPNQTGWRKNRNPGLQGEEDGIGVDVNRNYDIVFDFDRFFVPHTPLSVSDQPSDHETYQGPCPFSEAESRNVAWLFDTFTRTRWFIDLHSCGNKILHCWSIDEMQSNDGGKSFRNPDFDRKRGPKDDDYKEFIPSADLQSMQSLATVMANAIVDADGPQYETTASYWYYGGVPIPGASHDYAYSRHIVNPSLSKILGFVVEWGSDQQPWWHKMPPIISHVTAGLVGFCFAAAGVGS